MVEDALPYSTGKNEGARTMQPEEEGHKATAVIVKLGDRYYMSMGLLEYSMDAAQSDEQRAGVRAVMEAYDSVGPTGECQVAMFRPQPDFPKPLNTGFF